MSELLSLIRAGQKPVVGMVQLGALPGGSRYGGATIDDVLGAALAEAAILAAHGVHAMMVQNLGDIPVDTRVATVQATWMTRVATEIRHRFSRPIGLNMLENDAEAMFAVASASGADFVRIKIYVGAMVTPFGIETAQAFSAIRARTSWHAEAVAILADVHDRTGAPLVPDRFEDDVDAAVRLGAADALVLTGNSYAQTHEMIAAARRTAGAVPILVGGGVTAENVAAVNAVADGTIVSSSLKGSGTAFGCFDPDKVQTFLAAARAASPGGSASSPQASSPPEGVPVMRKIMSALGAAAVVAASLLATAAAEARMRVAMVTSESGLGDKSFNDMMNEGMKKAQADLGIDFVVIQPRSISEFQSTLARAAGQGFDFIVGSSFDMIKPIQTVAKAFPNQKFGLVDVGPDPIAPNVVSSVTKDWEGSFLVGAIAAKTTKTGTIGFVGGKDIPIIHRFYIGYYYGAKMADPKVNVLETYSGTFTDPAAGKEYTLALVNQKSDINFAVAGATSAGVIDAAKSTKTFAIGVDSDQNYLAPGFVLTSMVKRVDTQAYDMIKSVVDNSFKGGTVLYYGLKEGGVAAAMDQYNKGLIADDVLKQVDDLKAKVISGEIVVPNYFDLKPGQKEMGTPPMATPPSIADKK